MSEVSNNRQPLTDRLRKAAKRPTPSAVLGGVLAEYGLGVYHENGAILGPDDLTVEQVAGIAYDLMHGLRGDDR